MNKNIQAIYPLSPLQEGILFHTIEAPKSDIYFQQFSCVLENLHDAKRWQRAWQATSTRHGVMRTLFTWENRAQPLQIVRETVRLPWTELDWQDKSPAAQKSDWQQLKTLDRDANFDLSIAPLMRFTLVRISNRSYQFLFSFHHIVLDGWSQRRLIEEALDMYNQPGEIDLSEDAKPETRSFADFIEYINKTDKPASKAFWTQTLAGFSQATNVVNNKSSSYSQQSEIDENIRNTQQISLSPEQLTTLLTQARTHQLTLNSLILGAWSLVLASHNYADDVVFGTTVAGRPIELPQSDKIAGLFINTLPFRAKVEAELSLSSWLAKLQSLQAKCRQYEHTPLNEIQRYSELGSGNSLFESIVVVENLPPAQVSQQKHALTLSHAQYTEYSHYPFALLVDPSDGLNLIAVHQECKVSTSRAQDILAQLQSVLLQMSDSLDKPVSSIDTLPLSRRKRLENEWKGNRVDFGGIRLVHEAFEQQALRYPEHTAIIQQRLQTESTDIELSYQQVNQAANQLARALIEKGIGRGDIVPILLNKSADSIISFLAVMKTGAAYVALDPEQPASRLNTLVKSLEAKNLLVISTQNIFDTSFGSQAGLSNSNVFLLDAQKQALSAHSSENIELDVAPNDVAYLIFTSGSTGTPKGVLVEHAALMNSSCAREHFYEKAESYQTGDMRFLLLSSLSTDSSIAGVYWSLLSGNTLVLPVNKVEQDMQALQSLFLTYQISHTLCIPSLYSLILEHIDTTALGSLDSVIVAGETCPARVVTEHKGKLENTHLFNEYGPSECCVWASVSCLSDKENTQTVSIGSAIANTQLYVLDKHRKALLPNVVGELYIAGSNLARGYLHQEKKTNEVFLANPYFDPDLSNALMYKTGDLVKYDENGELTFIGRADNQIKVRGFRLEPEEIEQVLMQHDDVEEALVCIERPNVNDTQLLDALMAIDVNDAEKLLSDAENNVTVG